MNGDETPISQGQSEEEESVESKEPYEIKVSFVENDHKES